MIKRKLILSMVSVMALLGIAASGIIPKDNVMARETGPDLAGIVLTADSMVASLTVWENDTFPPKTLTPCMCSVVQYTLCQPVMYSTDDRVYTAFYADVRLVIYNAGTSVTLELDYNINKWRLVDDKGKPVCRHDLRNTELLSLVHELWPESKNINIKYKKFIE